MALLCIQRATEYTYRGVFIGIVGSVHCQCEHDSVFSVCVMQPLCAPDVTIAPHAATSSSARACIHVYTSLARDFGLLNRDEGPPRVDGLAQSLCTAVPQSVLPDPKSGMGCLRLFGSLRS